MRGFSLLAGVKYGVEREPVLRAIWNPKIPKLGCNVHCC